MRIVEFEAKSLLKKQRIRVPSSYRATCPKEARTAATKIGGPVAVKAQIPMGRRLQAGGVGFAETPEETDIAASKLLGSKVLGFPVEQVLVEEKLRSKVAVFLGVTYDTNSRSAVLLGSRSGGTDVESASSAVTRKFSVRFSLPGLLAREVAEALGFTDQESESLARVAITLVKCFLAWDALLLELNPLVLDSRGKWTALDVHLELDDDAAYRQKELQTQCPVSIKFSEARSHFELEAARIDSLDHRGVAGRLVPFEGNLGLLIGGGGASLTTMDAILNVGLKPANYCEIGGNPSVRKIQELTKLILSQPQVDGIAVIMNVVSNTRVDLVARGVIKGVLELGFDPCQIIMAFRVPGSWEQEGQAILSHYGIKFWGRETSIDEVVDRIRWQS